MKPICLLILVSFSLCAMARKKPIQTTFHGQYVFLDGSSVIISSGLLFVGYNKKDSSGRGISLSLGFPIYPNTIASNSHQKHALGLDFGYTFANQKLGKKGYLSIEPRILFMSRSEEDRYDFYFQRDTFYHYTYARIHSFRFGFNPVIVFNRFISKSFLMTASIGVQTYIEKVTYDHLFRDASYVKVPLNGISPPQYQVGWNKFLREFIGLKVAYRLK